MVLNLYLSAERWFKARNGTLTVVQIQRTYPRGAAKRWFKSGQTILQVTACDLNYELAAAANMCFLFDPNGSSHIAFGGANKAERRRAPGAARL